MNAIKDTDFHFPGQTDVYKGKVRDVYSIGDDYLAIVASDRISAFDYILPAPIPFKGQVLNQISAHFFEAVGDMVPTHVVSTPDPNVTIGLKCKPVMVEVVVRGYLAGHAWRTYNSGKRELCGVALPDGLKEGDKLPEPIITPATKSTIGHDEDISEFEILKSGLLEADEWGQIKHYALSLFDLGTKMAAEQGLILVDTKYEFGERDGQIYLIDEVHTPDSSRYYYLDGYAERQAAGERQKQLSKEFVREWLMENGFQGLDGQVMPEMPEEFVNSVTERYVELYERITGKKFVPADVTDIQARIEANVVPALAEINA
ncbi:phosphoribosylaminoimidazolesuccinocarboxamide synthase [Pontibacter sp. G13]|uniref:phosphoribosylaminoimidazolesuccinocarboxamide synthase n=1 Tax=Pontibacter sp. G13 TaxID=3074898 RepID=UPI003906CF08